MKTFPKALAALLVLITGAVAQTPPDNADEETGTLRLVCSYSHTVQDDGTSGATSGQELLTVTYRSNGIAVIRKQGLGAVFDGRVTEEEIVGSVEYAVGETSVQEEILINRYTGEFRFIYIVTGDSASGLVHYGNCERAAERKF